MAKAPSDPAKPRVSVKPKAPAKPKTVAVTPAETPPSAPRPRADWVKVGVGVGSAALVAALLYATRSKTKDWSK